jgi:hypothetical protein
VIARHLILLAVLSVGFLAATGCSIPERGAPVPLADTTRAQPLGIANVRFYADDDGKALTEEGMRALERERTAIQADKPLSAKANARLPPANYLAVSGGGDNGAFGAGLLDGNRHAAPV